MSQTQSHTTGSDEQMSNLPVVGYLIESIGANDQLKRKLVLGPLTDDVYMDETSEAFALCKVADAAALSQSPAAEAVASQPSQPAAGAQGVEYPYTALAEIAELVGHDTSKGFRANLVESVRAALASAQPIEQWEHCGWAVFYAEKDEKAPRFCWAKSEADRWSSYTPDSTVERVYRRLKSAPQQSTAIDVLEQAAQVADRARDASRNPLFRSAAKIIAADIRALKSSPPATEAGEQQ